MKKTSLILLLLVGTLTFAQSEKTSKTKSETFWVNGVCEMCQKRIQKAALNVKGVKMAQWDIESKMLTVIYKTKKCSLQDIQKAIAKAGHDNKGFRATDEAYENLHYCCHYERIN